MSKKPVCIEARSIVSGRNLEPYISLFLLYDDKNMALDWLQVWIDNSPKKICYADPTPRPRRVKA